MPGPLPAKNKRRRNAPTIPTTSLPAGGRPGPVPKPPTWIDLGRSGTAWWKWAWKTPQAAAWSVDGHRDTVARRASLQDDLTTLDDVDSFDLAELLDLAGTDLGDAGTHLEYLIGRLKRLAGKRLAVVKEMRELDDRLGLSPKGMAQLRWEIRADAEPAGPAHSDEGDEVADRRRKREERLEQNA